MRHPTTTAVTRLLAGGLLLLAISAAHFTAAAPPAAVWLADGKLLKRIDTQTNQLTLTLPLTQEPKALAAHPDGSVWVLHEETLAAFTAQGQPLLSISLKTLSLKGQRLVLDPYDHSLWLAGDKTLVHLDAQAQLLHTWSAPDKIKALRLDTDQTLWVLTDKQLFHLSAQIAILHTKILVPLIKDPESLLIDGLAGLGWIAGEKTLWQLDLRDLNKAPLNVALPPDTEFEALALHPLFGTVYAATGKTLLFHDCAGQLVKTLDLSLFKLDDDLQLLMEPQTGSLWIGDDKIVIRLTSNGVVETTLTFTEKIKAMGAAPFHLLPTVTLLDPPANALTRHPQPPFRLGLGAECNATPCELVDAYTQGFTLDATLNGLAIGSLFTITQGEALHLPPTRLPEGLNRFSVQAKDIFGHLSNRIDSQVTIDTIPPHVPEHNPHRR